MDNQNKSKSDGDINSPEEGAEDNRQAPREVVSAPAANQLFNQFCNVPSIGCPPSPSIIGLLHQRVPRTQDCLTPQPICCGPNGPRSKDSYAAKIKRRRNYYRSRYFGQPPLVSRAIALRARMERERNIANNNVESAPNPFMQPNLQVQTQTPSFNAQISNNVTSQTEEATTTGTTSQSGNSPPPPSNISTSKSAQNSQIAQSSQNSQIAQPQSSQNSQIAQSSRNSQISQPQPTQNSQIAQSSQAGQAQASSQNGPQISQTGHFSMVYNSQPQSQHSQISSQPSQQQINSGQTSAKASSTGTNQTNDNENDPTNTTTVLPVEVPLNFPTASTVYQQEMIPQQQSYAASSNPSNFQIPSSIPQTGPDSCCCQPECQIPIQPCSPVCLPMQSCTRVWPQKRFGECNCLRACPAPWPKCLSTCPPRRICVRRRHHCDPWGEICPTNPCPGPCATCAPLKCCPKPIITICRPAPPPCIRVCPPYPCYPRPCRRCPRPLCSLRHAPPDIPYFNPSLCPPECPVRETKASILRKIPPPCPPCCPPCCPIVCKPSSGGRYCCKRDFDVVCDDPLICGAPPGYFTPKERGFGYPPPELEAALGSEGYGKPIYDACCVEGIWNSA